MARLGAQRCPSAFEAGIVGKVVEVTMALASEAR